MNNHRNSTRTRTRTLTHRQRKARANAALYAQLSALCAGILIVASYAVYADAHAPRGAHLDDVTAWVAVMGAFASFIGTAFFACFALVTRMEG